MTEDIQSAARLARLIETSRAVHLGIALGDAADHLISEAPVRRGGVATQLTLATTEGVIRAMERAGQGLDVDWGHESLESLCRWGRLQQISGVSPSRSTVASLLASVPAYAERRGSAPATVRALRHGPAQVQGAGQQSLGAHALVRTLPLGTLLPLNQESVTNIAATCASVTHGHPLVGAVAAVGVGLIATAAGQQHLLAQRWLEALQGPLSDVPDPVRNRVGAAVTAGTTAPSDPDQLAALTPDRTGLSVLAAAVYAALSHPDPADLPLAFALAAFAPDKQATSAVTGALLAARFGSTPLIHHGAARLELGWACEALGTDLAMTAALSPLGKEPDGQPWLPSWGQRFGLGTS